jgi:hypothetical protein
METIRGYVTTIYLRMNITGTKSGNTYGAYRLDRILYKNIPFLKPKSIKVLDNKLPKYEKEKKNENLISDHKGLLATFVL